MRQLLHPPGRPVATGTGPWPGLDALEAARSVFGELGADDGMPFLPELPERGPGADPLGRTAAMLVELPVDLQPMGWRLVDHAGRDAGRARSMATADTDALAEAADGWSGPLKTQVIGPWSLAAGLWLPRGERVAVDRGATRDLAESLTAGIGDHVAALRRLVPGADVVVVVDEPSLPAVLEGRLPTASGWGRLPAPDPARARQVLRDLVAGVDAPVVLRCTARGAPWGLLREVAAAGLAADVGALTSNGWESLATAVEEGQWAWLGVLDPAVLSGGSMPSAASIADVVRRPWHEVGLDASGMARVVLAPTAGLAGLPPDAARAVLARLRESARALEEVALSA